MSWIQNKRVKIILVGLLFLFIVIELNISRFHFLDDTFIHLRIAHNLLDNGFFSFNGDIQEFSTSSPLYTSILALFSIFSRSPILPKIINDIIYFVVFVIIASQFLRNSDQVKTLFSFACLIVFSSPMSIRWMTDGMETGFVTLFSIIIGISVFKIGNETTTKPFPRISILLSSAAAVFLRIEFGYILALAIITITFLPSNTKPFQTIKMNKRIWNTLCKVMPFILGGIIGYGLIITIFGTIIPDTAIAKQPHGNSINLFQTVMGIARAHVGASFFGFGLFILWLVSFFYTYKENTKEYRMSCLLVNLGMLLFFCLIAITQQAIQGIRYFIFIETFLITLNIQFLPNTAKIFQPKKIQLAFWALLFFWIGVDFYFLNQISSGRSVAYTTFTENSYKFLENKKGIAWDIGMIGFFTKGYIYDINGLVNGQQWATMNEENRLLNVKNENVDFIFVNENQLKSVNKTLDTSAWIPLGEYPSPNLSGPDTHFLFVRPEIIQ